MDVGLEIRYYEKKKGCWGEKRCERREGYEEWNDWKNWGKEGLKIKGDEFKL